MKSERSERRSLNLVRQTYIQLSIAFLLVASFFAFSFAPIPGMADADSDKTRTEAGTDAWSTGYWIWRMPGSPSGSIFKGSETGPLYVDAGSLFTLSNRGLGINMWWPEQLPKASAYFALLRVETASTPPEDIIPKIIAGYRSLKNEAFWAGQPLSGLQLDFDCPTVRLGEYARFLKQLREVLPRDDRLSITALLDWFRPGTKIADVLQWVDEYAPQFFDQGNPGGPDENPGFATVIDASKWAPVFNSHSRPYRIGIATYGRMSRLCVAKDNAASPQTARRKFIREYDSFEIARQRQLKLISETRSQAGERILRFNTADGKYSECGASGEIIEMVVPTRESVLAAYDSAKKFGGLCRGVVFFRWPAENEAMVLNPDEVSAFISGGESFLAQPAVEAEDGFCAAVSCVNLYLRRSGDRFSQNPLTFRIHVSTDLEYFLPRESLHAKMLDRRLLEVRLPAYLGEPRIYLGRAVSRGPAAYSVEWKK